MWDRELQLDHYDRFIAIAPPEDASLYMDVIDEIALFFHLGLPPGSLSRLIIGNRPFVELRAACHEYVDDDALRDTVAFVHSSLNLSGENGHLEIKAADYLLMLGRDIERRAREARA